jgi:acyl-CoA hydrolase
MRDFEGLAKAGRLLVVRDDSPLPALPAGVFDDACPEDVAIANNVANHVELNLGITAGRAIQVGFGPMGCLAIKALLSSSWTGRCYTEMLEPYTWELFESGRVAGTHFVEFDGRRTRLDGKIICTFAMAEEGSGFYRKLHDNPAVIVAPAARVVIPEAFHGGLGINSCLSVDFQGHVNTSGRDRNHYSGIGGGAIILRGLARGGIAYLCMKSTHRTPDGRVRSSVFPYLPQGTPVSYVGPDLMGGRSGGRVFLATEHGVAQLSGTDQHSFIQAIVSVASPRYRDSLRKAAWDEFRVAIPGVPGR